jgi:hypothetical protein
MVHYGPTVNQSDLNHFIDLRRRRMQIIGVDLLETIQHPALHDVMDDNMTLQAILVTELQAFRNSVGTLDYCLSLRRDYNG